MNRVIYILDKQGLSPQDETSPAIAEDYRLVRFDDPETFLERFDEAQDSDVRPFCIIINSAELSHQSWVFLKNLDARQSSLPVLIVDHEQFNLRRQDYCRTLSARFPLFVCQPDEVFEFVTYFKVLGHRVLSLDLRRKSRVESLNLRTA